VFLSIIWCKFQEFKLHGFPEIEFFLGVVFLYRTLYIVAMIIYHYIVYFDYFDYFASRKCVVISSVSIVIAVAGEMKECIWFPVFVMLCNVSTST